MLAKVLFSRTQLLCGGLLSLLPNKDHLHNLLAELPARIQTATACGDRILFVNFGNEQTFVLKSLRRFSGLIDIQRSFKEKSGYCMTSANEVLMSWYIKTELEIETEIPVGFLIIGDRQYAIFEYHPGIDWNVNGNVMPASEEIASEIYERIEFAGFRFGWDGNWLGKIRHLLIDYETGQPRLIDTEGVYRQRRSHHVARYLYKDMAHRRRFFSGSSCASREA